MDELFRRCGEAPAYKPTAVIVPPIAIDQWINDFRNNAPTVNLLIYWGSKGDKKDSWWTEHHISSKDFADGPEKVPERLKYIFDTTDRRAASTVILTTHQTIERRTKYTAQIQGSE
jgi:SNF2 family DNA or RNA helicase